MNMTFHSLFLLLIILYAMMRVGEHGFVTKWYEGGVVTSSTRPMSNQYVQYIHVQYIINLAVWRVLSYQSVHRPALFLVHA